MARFSYHADGNLGAVFKNYFKGVTAAAIRQEDEILIALNDAILALTPVWEGELIVNWRWSTKAPIYGHIDPVESPTDPGHTGKSSANPDGMPLGQEPRRKMNSVRPKQSLAGALSAKEPVGIFLTNASDIAVDAEYGLVPTKDRSRSANGIVRLAIRQVMGRLTA